MHGRLSDGGALLFLAPLMKVVVEFDHQRNKGVKINGFIMGGQHYVLVQTPGKDCLKSQVVPLGIGCQGPKIHSLVCHATTTLLETEKLAGGTPTMTRMIENSL